MSLHPLGAPAELGGLGAGPSEQLDERRPGRREPLGHLRRHRRVVRRRLPLEGPDAPADPPGRDHEQRQQPEGEQRDRPRQAEHHGEREHERDDVRDDAGERRRERALGADDVVVQAADEGAGVGAREERDRHRLDVLEHAPAQVEDQPLAETRRRQALEQPDAAPTTATTREEHGDRDDQAAVALLDDRVDGPPGEHGRQHAEQRRHRRQGEERDDRATVRAGERAARGATSGGRRGGGRRRPAWRSAARATSGSRT